MTLSISPDTSRPGGGYAVCEMPAEQLAQGETSVAVRDPARGYFLGVDGWQPEKLYLGPYLVEHEQGRAQFMIGPEIVNQLVANSDVEIEVDGILHRMLWPQGITQLMGASSVGRDRGESLIRERTAAPEPTPPPVRQGRSLVENLLIVILGLGAVGLAYFLFAFSDDGPTDVVGTPSTTTTASTTLTEPSNPATRATVPCTADGIASVLGSFDARFAEVERCGAALSPDAALQILDSGIAAESPDALLRLGKVYDPAAADPVIEDQIGLVLGDNLPRAAEYYARAERAGARAAGPFLRSVCGRLDNATDTLSVSAFEDYCS